MSSGTTTHLRAQFTLQTQLMMPLMPLIFDTLARVLFLRHVLNWYEIPDLVTLLVTFSFFCLGLMFSVKQNELKKDEEVTLNIDIVKQKLLNIGLASMMAAGAISFYRAFNDRYPALKIGEENGAIVFSAVVAFIAYNVITILRKYISYVGG